MGVRRRIRARRSCLVLIHLAPRGAAVSDRIDVNAHIHFGKPCVKGTRITVQSVLELVREGIAPADICRDYYPDLSADDVRACVQYAIDLIALEDIRLVESV